MSYIEPTNDDRADWAEVAVEAFKRETRMEGEDLETCMGDLLCDLHHLADSQKIDWNRLIARAQDYHAAERDEHEIRRRGGPMTAPEPHVCQWGSIIWDGVHDDNLFPEGDDWISENHGTCTCGRRVKEVFVSDGELRDIETGEPVEGD